MARLNIHPNRNAPLTHEGAPAKRINAEQELRRTVMACLLWERTFYEGGVSVADRIRDLVAKVPKEAVAAMAIEAREQMHLRHAPLLLVREMARSGGKVVGNTIARVIQRPDELTELLAIYWQDGKEPLSAQVKHGLAEAFVKFDAYQLAKYDRPDAIRLRDVLFLCHAKPRNQEQALLWKRLVDGTLDAPDTWEVALSANDGESKTDKWDRLLRENKLGGLALLRNLRNMIEADVERTAIAGAIHRAKFSRVLPFRFIAAARYAPDMEPALEPAMLRSLEEMDKLPGKTALLIDHSGSMGASLSERSQLTRFEAACGLAILVREIAEDVDVIAFSDWNAVVPPRRGFALADAIRDAGRFWGTYTEDAKRLADSRGYDRIIILTDEQSHQALSDPLQGAPGYVVNVATYRNGIGYGRWTHIDGWSENVVRYIMEVEGVLQ